MGLLDRLHKMDDEAEQGEPEPPPETAERVAAILGVVEQFLDHSNSFAMTLYVIARRELAQANAEQIDNVIRGTVYAAQHLYRFLPPELLAGTQAAEEPAAPPAAASGG